MSDNDKQNQTNEVDEDSNEQQPADRDGTEQVPEVDSGAPAQDDIIIK